VSGVEDNAMTQEKGGTDQMTYSPIGAMLHARENLSFLVRPRDPIAQVSLLRSAEDGYPPGVSRISGSSREREQNAQTWRDRWP
jgi:hypothetical protein